MLELTAKDVMTPDVLTVGEDWLIDQLAEFLVSRGISGAPVVDDAGKLTGVVSVTDIARFNSLPVRDTRAPDRHEFYHHVADLEVDGEELGGYHLESEALVSVRDIMTPVVFSVSDDARLPQVADTMVRGRIHRVLVTHGDEVVGIVTALDVLKVMREL